MKRRIIYPLDGFEDPFKLLDRLERILETKAGQLISHIKLNDALHLETPSGPKMVEVIVHALKKHHLKEIKIFLDFKLADVKGTNKNIVQHYYFLADAIDIITVRSCCSLDGIQAVKDVFPQAHIALVSVLTDMSPQECIIRFGEEPSSRIFNDIQGLSRYCNKFDKKVPYDSFVCSPAEVEDLKNTYPDLISIVPGIRDKWMAAGQQDPERMTGVAEALRRGADFLVMGSQLSKGNPEKGISADQSCEMTMEEIEKFEQEQEVK